MGRGEGQHHEPGVFAAALRWVGVCNTLHSWQGSLPLCDSKVCAPHMTAETQLAPRTCPQVANAAILHRAYPSAARDLVVHFVGFCTAMVALLGWSLLGRRSYTRWRQLVHIAIRVDSIFTGCRR